MLPLPNLNEKSKEMLFEEALQKLKIYGREIWNDFDIHDPGITFLELLCYLKEKQQQSIEKMDDKTLLQISRLLGINKKGAKPAQALAEIKTEKDMFLPKGTRFLAGKYIYESHERMFLQNNTITGLGMGKHFWHWDGGAKEITLFQEQKELLLYFEKPIAQNHIISIYITMKNQNRNAITDKESFLPAGCFRTY